MRETAKGAAAVRKEDRESNGMENIHYLKEEQKQKTRRFYETVFEEDSKEFVDYYYQQKMKENEILVMEGKDGEAEVMIHLNPYRMNIGRSAVETAYIVAVATRADCRRQGKMQQVMEQALRDRYENHQPLVFLLPADPAYYYGQGFSYFPCQPAEERREEKSSQLQAAELRLGEEAYTWEPASPADVRMLAEAANTILAEAYEVFIQRDEAYYRRMLAEAACENGKILIIRQNTEAAQKAEARQESPKEKRKAEGMNLKSLEEIAGILVYGAEAGKAEIKELIWRSGQQQEGWICDRIFGKALWKNSDMRMMVRITDLQSLHGTLRSPGESARKINVKDAVIPENTGCFWIRTGPDGGEIRRAEPDGTEKEVDISLLAQQLFAEIPVFIREWV